MRLSQYFLPTLKETPSEARIVSHRYMLRAGMVRQASAGIYSWLPLGLRVLRKIEQIVREDQNAAGGQEVLMPTKNRLPKSLPLISKATGNCPRACTTSSGNSAMRYGPASVSCAAGNS
jgi:hypothetical protein